MSELAPVNASGVSGWISTLPVAPDGPRHVDAPGHDEVDLLHVYLALAFVNVREPAPRTHPAIGLEPVGQRRIFPFDEGEPRLTGYRGWRFDDASDRVRGEGCSHQVQLTDRCVLDAGLLRSAVCGRSANPDPARFIGRFGCGLQTGNLAAWLRKRSVRVPQRPSPVSPSPASVDFGTWDARPQPLSSDPPRQRSETVRCHPSGYTKPVRPSDAAVSERWRERAEQPPDLADELLAAARQGKLLEVLAIDQVAGNDALYRVVSELAYERLTRPVERRGASDMWSVRSDATSHQRRPASAFAGHKNGLRAWTAGRTRCAAHRPARYRARMAVVGAPDDRRCGDSRESHSPYSGRCGALSRARMSHSAVSGAPVRTRPPRYRGEHARLIVGRVDGPITVEPAVNWAFAPAATG